MFGVRVSRAQAFRSSGFQGLGVKGLRRFRVWVLGVGFRVWGLGGLRGLGRFVGSLGGFRLTRHYRVFYRAGRSVQRIETKKWKPRNQGTPETYQVVLVVI